MGKELCEGSRANGGRIVYWDLLRVIAIACMLTAHVASANFYSQPVSSFNWKVFNVYVSLTRYCMPVFVMLSGVFLLNPEKPYTIKRLFQKNILRIFIALVFWTFCYALLLAWFQYKTVNADMLKKVLEGFLGGRYHLWFLYMLIGLYLVTPLLRKIAESKKLCEYYMLLSFLAASVMPVVTHLAHACWLNDAVSKTGLYMVLGYTGYYIAGYYLSAYKISKKAQNVSYILAVLGVAATIAVTAAASAHRGKPVDAYYNGLYPNTCVTAVGLFIIFQEKVSKVRFREKTVSFIRLLAKCSFGMYLTHDFINVALRYVNITTLSFNPLLSVPALSLTVIAASFVISYVINKIPVLNRYIV